MDSGLLNIELCSAVPIFWLAMGLYWRRCEHRHRQWEGRWEHFARNRVQLDRELDRPFNG